LTPEHCIYARMMNFLVEQDCGCHIEIAETACHALKSMGQLSITAPEEGGGAYAQVSRQTDEYCRCEVVRLVAELSVKNPPSEDAAGVRAVRSVFVEEDVIGLLTEELRQIVQASREGADRLPERIHRLKREVLAAIANLVHDDRRAQDQVLAHHTLQALFACSGMDEKSPLSREWALMAVRNLMMDNEDIQEEIRCLEPQGVVDTEEMRKLGVSARFGPGGKLQVSQVDREKRAEDLGLEEEEDAAARRSQEDASEAKEPRD